MMLPLAHHPRSLTLVLVPFLIVASVDAAPFSGTVTFTEYPFPTTTTSVVGTTPAYNLVDDATGAFLGADNGDQADVNFAFSLSGSGAGISNQLQWDTVSTGRYLSTTSFNLPVAINNPGTRIAGNTVVTFGSHMTVTDATASFTSLNTAGVSWEFSLIGFLKADGTSFSPQPVIPAYLDFDGVTGNIAQGWFLAGSKGTVVGVGGNDVSAGVSGPNDNFTFDYASAGLDPGTQIGGIVYYHFLEDTRGTLDTAASTFTSSLTQFTFSGSVVPEPGSALLLAVAGAVVLFVGRSRRL